MEITVKTIEVHFPLGRVLAILAVCGILFGAAIFRTYSASSGSRDQIYGIAGIVILGIVLIALIWRVISIGGPVLILSPTGIRDVRIIQDEVPWHAIRNVRVWEDDGDKYLVLDVDPHILPHIRMTRIAHTMSWPFIPVSEDGVLIAPAGLPIDFETLFQEATHRMNLAIGRVDGPAQNHG